VTAIAFSRTASAILTGTDDGHGKSLGLRKAKIIQDLKSNHLGPSQGGFFE